jgi:hypothetical protein
MSENVLIPLPNLSLPGDFPWQVGFVAMVDEQLRRLRASGHFLPPRFFGYFFRAGLPVGVGGSWTVSLDARPPIQELAKAVQQITRGHFSITSRTEAATPEFILIHDRRDGACWLWTFAEGMKFIEANDPVFEPEGLDSAEKPKLLGP